MSTATETSKSIIGSGFSPREPYRRYFGAWSQGLLEDGQLPTGSWAGAPTCWHSKAGAPTSAGCGAAALPGAEAPYDSLRAELAPPTFPNPDCLQPPGGDSAGMRSLSPLPRKIT